MVTAELVQLSFPADGVALLKMTRPDKLNALSVAMVDQLRTSLITAGAHPNVRALILTGKGRGFCAGADLSEFDRLLGPAPLDAISGVTRYHELARTLAELPVPTVAAINGIAVGGGVGLALLCDIRVMNKTARITINQIERGIIPDMGTTYLLPRLLGAAWATYMMLLPGQVNADEALRIGLVHEVADQSQVFARSLELAARLASYSPTALRMTREAIAAGMQGSLSDALRHEAIAQSICSAVPGFSQNVRESFRERTSATPNSPEPTETT